jgi:hypothetical protein
MPRPRKNAAPVEAQADGQTKRRGRPPGSKNGVTKRRGRRPGTKNRAKTESLAGRIGAMIGELEGLRARVRELESQAGQIDQVRSLLK